MTCTFKVIPDIVHQCFKCVSSENEKQLFTVADTADESTNNNFRKKIYENKTNECLLLLGG